MQEFADMYCGVCPLIPKAPWLGDVLVGIANKHGDGDDRFLGFRVSTKVRVKIHSKHSKRQRYLWIWPDSNPVQFKCRTGLHRFKLTWVQIGLLMAGRDTPQSRKIYLGEDYLDDSDSNNSNSNLESWHTFSLSGLRETIDGLSSGNESKSEITFKIADVIQMMSKYTRQIDHRA